VSGTNNSQYNNMTKFLYQILLSPFLLVRKTFTLLAILCTKCATKTNILISQVQQIPRKIRPGVNYYLKPIGNLSGFVKIAEVKGGMEDIILPKIVGLTNGGKLSVNMPDDYLCKLDNVSFVPYSDFLRDSLGNVSNEKLLRKEYDVLIPRDRDILKINGSTIKLSSRKAIVEVKVGFNLMGTYSNHWAHFFAQYYPKLEFLSALPINEIVEIIIPEGTDLHIKYLIEFEVQKFPNLRILEVNIDSEIICQKLYHVSLGTFIADEGYFPTPFAIMISKSTLKFWKKKSSELISSQSKQYRKIFIGRSGGRSLTNNDEVKSYFINLGFEEIFPHLLDIKDKIRIFNEAKYIVGAGSSGFVNTVYCQPGTKILSFFNSFRYLDTLLPAYSAFNGQEFWFMTGRDEDLKEMNSNYSINLKDIKLFLSESNFLDEN
jgi:hypothetical protein